MRPAALYAIFPSTVTCIFASCEQSASEQAYFKSTDGHFGNWGFNLRRPNLHLLPLVCDALSLETRGFILVDSTRAGKRIPDALSKTLPIWCAVINRAAARLHRSRASDEHDWDTELYCPPGAVSEQERNQIKARLDGWAEDLVVSTWRVTLEI